jgi:hypothetical protein
MKLFYHGGTEGTEISRRRQGSSVVGSRTSSLPGKNFGMTRAVHVHEHVNVNVHVNVDVIVDVNVDVLVNVIGFCWVSCG